MKILEVTKPKEIGIHRSAEDFATIDLSKSSTDLRKMAMENLCHINEIERNPKMNHVIDYRDWADYKNTMKKTGKSIEGYNIWTDGANLVLESPETGEPAGVLATDDFSGMKQVAIELKPNLRGKDIAVRLYLFAIVILGWDIVSDGEQSLGSERMWDKLAHMVNVYVWDADKRKIIGKYNPADKKHVYDDDHYHIRLVATKTKMEIEENFADGKVKGKKK